LEGLRDSRYNPNLDLTKEAMDLLLDWWPQPCHATVTLETHQWERLRRFLLAVAGKEYRK